MRRMRALVIGGGRFVGAAIIDELGRRGSEVTVFSRGKTNPAWFAGLDWVRGDRATDLGQLGKRRFDVVIDTCGYTPAHVEPAAAIAAAQSAFYVFVSTASVYALDAGIDTVTEEHPLLTPESDGADGDSYGVEKVRCEAALREALGERLVILRPGLIVGPRDYTDRYLYWAWRVAQPGPVLVPGDGRDPVQLIDARDFARFAVDVGASATPGTFNVTGPPDGATFAQLIAQTTPPDTALDLVWANAAFLAVHAVSPWQDMPCWLPRDHDQAAILRLDINRALDAGLRTRLLAETATDTRQWMHAAARHPPFSDGLPPGREQSLIAARRSSS